MDVGTVLATSVPRDGQRIILAASVPCRAYAAVFAGLAAILGRITLKPAAADSQAYFEFLCSQHLGTHVIILREVKGSLKRFYGIIKGHGEDQWGRCLTVLYKVNKYLKEYAHIRPGNCRQVLIAPEDSQVASDRELLRKQRGFSVIKNVDFFEALVASKFQVDFLTGSRLDCLFIGNHARINEEMGVELFLGHGRGTTGTLHDIIRPRNLPAYTQSFRSLICSSEKKSLSGLNSDSPCCVIFDTARGFLKWGSQSLSPCCVVILDRSEPHYSLAMETLNNRYLQRLPDEQAAAFPVVNRPAGTEVLRFAERAND